MSVSILFKEFKKKSVEGTEMRSSKKLMNIIVIIHLVFIVQFLYACSDAASESAQGDKLGGVGPKKTDIMRPSVVSVSPIDGAVGVVPNAIVSVTFSDSMDALSITEATFSLIGPNGAVLGVVNADISNTTFTFTPVVALSPASYTSVISAAVKDRAGSTLSASYTWHFDVLETVPPVVLSTFPSDNSIGVATNAAISVFFSKEMDSATITSTTLLLQGPTGNIPGTVQYAGQTATFKPDMPLIYSTEYTATITSGAKDLAGNTLGDSYNWRFKILDVQPWSRTYGREFSNGVDLFYAIQPTAEGGYIVAGTTFTYTSGSDVWILKLDALGEVVWQKSYGGTSNDYACALESTSNGGYIVAGESASDAWVLKLDATGSIVWQKTYGGSNRDYVCTIQPTTDGGYVAAGATDSSGAGSTDAWVIKLNASGTVVWQKTYGGVNMDYVSVIRPADGGYVVVGSTDSFGAGSTDVWILKLDTSGAVAWQKTYGGVDLDEASDIQPTSDGGYVVSGDTQPPGTGDRDMWLLKLDAAGAVVWQKTYGGKYIDRAYGVYQTTDGYVVVGSTVSFGSGWEDAAILKLDSTGSVLWQKTYGGVNGENAYMIQPNIDGGYIVVGESANDAWVLKLDASGGIAFNSSSGVTSAQSALIVADSAFLSKTSVVVPATFISPVVADTSVLPKSSNAVIETYTASSNVLSAPTGLAATQQGKGALNLTWTDSSPDETGFIIFRSTDNQTFSRHATLPANTTTFSDSGTSGVTYYYKLEAYNASGYSDFSNIALVVVL